MPSLTVTPCKLACGNDGSGGLTEEEDLVSHTLGCIELQLLDRSFQVGPPIDTLVNETKVVVELEGQIDLEIFKGSEHTISWKAKNLGLGPF